MPRPGPTQQPTGTSAEMSQAKQLTGCEYSPTLPQTHCRKNFGAHRGLWTQTPCPPESQDSALFTSVQEQSQNPPGPGPGPALREAGPCLWSSLTLQGADTTTIPQPADQPAHRKSDSALEPAGPWSCPTAVQHKLQDTPDPKSNCVRNQPSTTRH